MGGKQPAGGEAAGGAPRGHLGRQEQQEQDCYHHQ